MSSERSTDPSGPRASEPAAAARAQPSEAGRSEIDQRAAYEAELSRITSAELMLQAAVSLLNVGSFRLAPRPAPGAGVGQPPAGEQAPRGDGGGPSREDLEQARDAIDGARALLEILERSVPSEIAPLRNALSQLQIAYARAAKAAGASPPPTGEAGGAKPSGGSSGDEPGGAPPSGEPQSGERPPGPGPAESSGRLWVPGR